MTDSPDMGDGGGYLSTNWSHWQVDHMAAVLEGEEPESVAAHSDAWFKVYLAAMVMHDRLTRRRTQLGAKWHGDAAAAYFTAFDDMLSALETTKNAALYNYQALNGMVATVKKAKTDMAPILAEWRKYDEEEAEYQDNWAIYKAFVDSPVSAGEREALNERARTVMNHASGGLFDSYTTMTTPPAYTFVGGSDFEEEGPGGSSRTGTGDGFNAPPVAPLRAQEPSPRERPAGAPNEIDPVLSGGSPPPGSVVPPPPPTWTPDAEPNTGRTVMPPVIGSFPRGVNGSNPGSRSAPGGSIGRPIGSHTGVEPVRGGAAGGRAGGVPSVIGGRPGMVGGMFGGAGASGGAHRVNPVGGVVGRGQGMAAGTVSAQKSRIRGQGDEEHAHDPQHPFDVDTSHASPSVLQPDPEPDFRDPGPAIGAAR